MEIASLAVEIDSTSVVQARADQDALTESGKRLEQQTGRLSSADQVYQSIARRTHETVDQVRARYEAAAAAQKKLAQAVDDQAKLDQVATQAMGGYSMSAERATMAIVALQATGKSFNEELARSIERLKGMGGVVDETGNQVGAFTLQTQRSRTDLMQLAGALSRGDLPAAFRQFIQLLTGTGAALKELIGLIAPAAAVGAVLAFFVKEAINVEKFNQALGKTEAALAGAGKAGLFSRGELTKYVQEIQRAGHTSEESAQKVVEAFARQGLIGRQVFGELIGLVPDFARAMGLEAPEAASKLADALGKPLTGVLELDKQINILTLSEYKQITAMEKAGDAAGIQAIALEALHRRFDGLRNEGITPLQTAWNELLDAWKGTPSEGEKTSSMMDKLAKNLSLLADFVRMVKTNWDAFLVTIGNTLPIQAANKVLEYSLKLRQMLGLAATDSEKKQAEADAAHAAHVKGIQEQDERAIAGQRAALAEKQRKEKAAYEESIRNEKKLADEKKRLLDLDAAGWVKKIDNDIKEYEDGLRAQAKALEAHEKEVERLRKLDDAGWVKKIEADIKEYEDGLRAQAALNKAYFAELDAQRAEVWGRASDLTANFFADLVMNGGSAIEKLKQLFKSLLAEMVAIFAKRWVLQLGAGVLGGGAGSAMASQAAGVGQGTLGGGVMDLLGSGLGAAGGFLGSFIGGGAGVAAPGMGLVTGIESALISSGGLGASIAGSGIVGMIGTAMPWIGAALAIYSLFRRKGSSKKESGSFLGSFDPTGGLLGELSGAPYADHREQQHKGVAREIVTGMAQGYANLVRSLGGQGQALQFGGGFVTNPRGDAPSFAHTMVRDAAGNVIFSQENRNISREEGALEEEIELQTQRAMLAALQHANFPGAFGDAIKGILNMVVAETAKPEQIEAVMALAQTFQSLSETIDYFTQTPLERWQTSMVKMTERISTASEAFDESLETKDPARILAAERELEAAVMARYNAEISMVRQLEQSIRQIEEAAYNFAIDIAQRINSVGGSRDIGAIAMGRATTLRGRVGGNAPLGQQAEDVAGYISAIDTWYSSRREAILRDAQEQLDAQNEYNQNVADGIRTNLEYHARVAQAEADALQKQLDVALMFKDIVTRTEGILKNMTLSSANPLPLSGRLGLLDTQLDTLRTTYGQSTGEARARAAGSLLEGLQVRLGMLGELHQRPSEAYMEGYNEIIAEITQIQQDALKEAEKAKELEILMLEAQQRSVALQEAASQVTATIATESADTNARLAALDEEALAHYTWAEQEGARIFEAQRAEQAALLTAITGGLEPNLFIAQRTTEMVEELRGIRADLANRQPPNLNINVNISGENNTDPEEVVNILIRNAPRIRRELAVS